MYRLPPPFRAQGRPKRKRQVDSGPPPFSNTTTFFDRIRPHKVSPTQQMYAHMAYSAAIYAQEGTGDSAATEALFEMQRQGYNDWRINTDLSSDLGTVFYRSGATEGTRPEVIVSYRPAGVDAADLPERVAPILMGTQDTTQLEAQIASVVSYYGAKPDRLVGYSMGGGHAILMSRRFDVEAVVFNPVVSVVGVGDRVVSAFASLAGGVGPSSVASVGVQPPKASRLFGVEDDAIRTIPPSRAAGGAAADIARMVGYGGEGTGAARIQIVRTMTDLPSAAALEYRVRNPTDTSVVIQNVDCYIGAAPISTDGTGAHPLENFLNPPEPGDPRAVSTNMMEMLLAQQRLMQAEMYENVVLLVGQGNSLTEFVRWQMPDKIGQQGELTLAVEHLAVQYWREVGGQITLAEMVQMRNTPPPPPQANAPTNAVEFETRLDAVLLETAQGLSPNLNLLSAGENVNVLGEELRRALLSDGGATIAQLRADVQSRHAVIDEAMAPTAGLQQTRFLGQIGLQTGNWIVLSIANSLVTSLLISSVGESSNKYAMAFAQGSMSKFLSVMWNALTLQQATAGAMMVALDVATAGAVGAVGTYAADVLQSQLVKMGLTPFAAGLVTTMAVTTVGSVVSAYAAAGVGYLATGVWNPVWTGVMAVGMAIALGFAVLNYWRSYQGPQYGDYSKITDTMEIRDVVRSNFAHFDAARPTIENVDGTVPEVRV